MLRTCLYRSRDGTFFIPALKTVCMRGRTGCLPGRDVFFPGLDENVSTRDDFTRHKLKSQKLQST